MTIQRPREFPALVHGQRTASQFVACSLLLALMVIGLPALSGAQQACQPDGDIDRNGRVTSADALLAFQKTLSLIELDRCQLRIADVFPNLQCPTVSSLPQTPCAFSRRCSV